MAVVVNLVGGGTRSVEIDGDTTYGDLLSSFDVTREEVVVVVAGQPVPEDEPVDPAVDRVRVIRLIKGG